MKELIVSLMVLIALSGCASTNYYVPSSAAKESLPTVSGLDERKGLTEWKRHQIIMIDDGVVKYPFGIWSVYDYKIPVDPGFHLFVVQTEFNRGGFWGGGPWRSIGEVYCEIKPGKRYKLESGFRGSKVLLWFVDADTDEVVSEVFEESFEKSPQNHYVPVFIPSN